MEEDVQDTMLENEHVSTEWYEGPPVTARGAPLSARNSGRPSEAPDQQNSRLGRPNEGYVTNRARPNAMEQAPSDAMLAAAQDEVTKFQAEVSCSA